MVLLPGLGKEVYGAQRWLRVFGFELQPSEFAKVAIIIYMAHWLTSRREQVRHFANGFLPFVVLLSVIVALLLKQPDLGTASVVVVTAVAIFFVAGAHPLQLAALPRGLRPGPGAGGPHGALPHGPHAGLPRPLGALPGHRLPRGAGPDGLRRRRA